MKLLYQVELERANLRRLRGISAVMVVVAVTGLVLGGIAADVSLVIVALTFLSAAMNASADLHQMDLVDDEQLHDRPKDEAA